MIEHVMNFKYLGMNISSNRNIYLDVKQQVIYGAKVSGSLRSVIWKNKYMDSKSKDIQDHRKTCDDLWSESKSGYA